MSSNVGNPALYEAGDQVNRPEAELQEEKKDARFHVGRDNSHKALDSSEISSFVAVESKLIDALAEDERTIANKLAREEKREKEAEEESEEVKQLKKDPTLPAKMHGNEPSRGAKIDAELQAEEEEELRRKGKA